MELLAQCSHALYNEELLFAKKRERELERELCDLKRQYCVPRVKYKNKEEWETVLHLFSKEITDFILMENYDLFEGAELTAYITDICKHYTIQLDTLLKNKHKKWCEFKSKELYNILQLSFCGLLKTHTISHWSPQQYRLFIEGVINTYTKSYQSYKYGYEHGWMDFIPYYDCVKCNNRIHGEYKYHGIYEYLFTQRCIPCIYETLTKVKCIQRCWQSYHKCNILNIKSVR